MRTTNTDCSFFQSLEDTLRYHFLPAITGKEAFSDTELGRQTLIVPFSSPLRTPLDTTSCLPSQERKRLVILNAHYLPCL